MSFLNEVKNHKYRTLKTFCLSLAFLCLGMFNAVPGPTMLDLQIAANTTLEKITIIFPSRSAGYALGSILSSIIQNWIDIQIIISISLFLSSVFFLTIPFIRIIDLMWLVFFLAGLSLGSIDTCGNVWVLHLWGKENAPFMQIVHFAFGLGSFISPFISEPFLLPILPPNSTQSNNLTTSNLLQSNTTDPIAYTYEDLKIQWVYIILVSISLIVFVLFAFVYLYKPINKPHPSRTLQTDSHKQANSTVQTNFSTAKIYDEEICTKQTLYLTTCQKYYFICIITLFMHFYIGIEISFGSLLVTYAVKSDLHLSKTSGSFLTSCYWGTFTFFRLTSLIAINYFSSKKIIIFNLTLISLSNIFLVSYGNQFTWALWLGVILMGLGCSSMFALVFSYLEEILPVTSSMTSAFMISSCIGEFVIPYLVGLYIDTKPFAYIIIIFVYSLSSILFMFMMFAGEFYLKNKQTTPNQAKSGTTNKFSLKSNNISIISSHE